MSSRRLRFALEHLDAGSWQVFERFAAAFLVEEFPTLWTTANPAGDRGRDGEVFVIGGRPNVLMQYSVQKDWAPKLRATAKRIKDQHSSARRIIYCTNQAIGAAADSVIEEIDEKYELQVQLRDLEWFADRVNTSVARSAAAAELAAIVVDPLLSSAGIERQVAAPLNHYENKVALLQLAFAAEDAGDRSLTRSSFDALVTAALKDSSAERVQTQAEVQAAVRELLPGGPSSQVNALVESALNRLSRKGGPVKKRSDSGCFHLSFEAKREWSERAARYLLDQEMLEEDIAAALFSIGAASGHGWDEVRCEAALLREALESVLMTSGERFVHAVQGAGIEQVSRDDLIADLRSHEASWTFVDADSAAEALLEALAGAQDETRAHLGRVLEAYTLLAFLRVTPDVQKTLSNLLDGGELWLDASAILPLLGELLIEDAEERVYTRMLEAARECGISLFVSQGMLTEVERHLNLCAALHRTPAGEWRSKVPFIYAAYTLSGRDLNDLPEWLAEIRGETHPVEDVAHYLGKYFGVVWRDLDDVAATASIELRGAVQALFIESHEKRRARGVDALDRSTIEQLAAHDVDDVVGIIESRREARLSPLGYNRWWLTLDSRAYGLGRRLRERLGEDAPVSPVLSPQFLAQLLRFGPFRKTLDPAQRAKLPLMTDLTRLESISPELLDLARATREQSAHFSEHRIQREVRDALQRARTTIRSADFQTGSQVDERIRSSLRETNA